MASRRSIPKNIIDRDAARAARKDANPRVVTLDRAERVPTPQLQWKFDESGLYIGTPHRVLRQRHGNSVVMILRVISKNEVEIMIDGLTMIVHPRELRPLDDQGDE